MVTAIRLRVERLPRMNRGVHWSAKPGERSLWGVLLRAALGRQPRPEGGPLKHARVTFMRFSATRPDSGDNVNSSFKLCRDLLQPPGKPNKLGHLPNRGGLGLIVSDSPKHLDAVYQWQRAPRGKGYIEIVVEEV